MSTDTPTTETQTAGITAPAAGTDSPAKISCPSCGATYDASQEACPYCGHVNEPADEQSFLRELDASKQEIQKMVDLPEETATKEVRRSGRLILTVLAVFAALALIIIFAVHFLGGTDRYHRDDEADYLWMQENLPRLQAAYDSGMAGGDFTELITLYEEGQKDGNPVWRFTHDAFTSRLILIKKNIPEEIRQAELLQEQNDGRYRNHLHLLLYDEMQLALIADDTVLSAEEKDYLRPLSEEFVADMRTRFSMTDEEFAAFRSDYTQKRFLSFSDCEAYVDERFR